MSEFQPSLSIESRLTHHLAEEYPYFAGTLNWAFRLVCKLLCFLQVRAIYTDYKTLFSQVVFGRVS